MNENNNLNQAIHQKSAKQFQAQNQESNQAAIEASEAKTVINGKVVSINQAQAAMEAAEAAVTSTGVQEAHSNHSEPVQAGQMGKTTAATTSEAARQAEMKIKQVNVQSGQAHLDNHMNQAAQSTQAQSAQAQSAQAQSAAATKAQQAKAKNQAAE